MIIQIKYKLKRPFPVKFIEKYTFYVIIYLGSLQKTPQKSQILNVIQEKVCLQKCVFLYLNLALNGHNFNKNYFRGCFGPKLYFLWIFAQMCLCVNISCNSHICVTEGTQIKQNDQKVTIWKIWFDK